MTPIGLFLSPYILRSLSGSNWGNQILLFLCSCHGFRNLFDICFSKQLQSVEYLYSPWSWSLWRPDCLHLLAWLSSTCSWLPGFTSFCSWPTLLSPANLYEPAYGPRPAPLSPSHPNRPAFVLNSSWSATLVKWLLTVHRLLWLSCSPWLSC